MEIKYGRGKFKPSKEYINYMNMIANSPVYDGLPNIREENGKINWQCSSGKTTSFYKFFPGRFAWWVNKADSLKLPGTENSDDRLTIAARIIHPTGKKVCLICGKERYVGYMYMNANLAKRWNKLVQSDYFEKTMPIYEATQLLIDELGIEQVRKQILSDFPEKIDDIELFDNQQYEQFFMNSQYKRSTNLSPGYMGDCPHRLDGIHDYCTFCRKKNDPGRSDGNMRTYNHDRRAFMWWADGDWKIADTLYNSASSGTCANCGKEVSKISPDHVGPLACGFKQNGFFEPLCGRCNSAKNRRFTYDNVISLIEYERTNDESVASWQVQTLWDETKENVSNDADVKILSNYMRVAQDYYLRVLTYVAKLGYYDFLSSLLHPEYANFEISFENLDTSNFTYSKINKALNITNGSRSLAARSVRIAFDELFEYSSKTTEQRKSIILDTVERYLSEDYFVIDDIFNKAKKNDIDNSIKQIIENNALSLDVKDSQLQIIIETDDFQQRANRQKETFSKIKDLFNARGHNFAELCLSEINNQ